MRGRNSNLGIAFQATASGGDRFAVVLCAGHGRRLGGESPLCNLMEVKH